MMEVTEIDGKFYVANGQRRSDHSIPTLRRGHRLDRHSDTELAHSDQYNQIRMAVNGSYQPDRY